MNILIYLMSFFALHYQNELVFGLETIIAGSNAGKTNFPYQVSFQKISRNNRHFCGGTIVSPKFILTATHCLDGQNLNDIRVVAGVTNLKNKLKAKNIRKVVRVFRHPSYNKPLPKDNDIALVKLDTAFRFTKNLNKADLPAASFRIRAGQEVTVSGWGIEKTANKDPTDRLKKTKVKVLAHAECVKRYQGKLKVSQLLFCTVHDGKSNKGVCNGDSGGPVTLNKKTVVGVIEGSYAHGECGSNTTPDLQTEVAKYHTWITNTIASNP